MSVDDSMVDDRDTWRRVEAMFDAAWEVVPEQRAAWLRAQPVAEDVIEQVEALLAAAVASEGFLESGRLAGPALAVPLPAILAVGDRAGAWCVMRMIGRGGMGEVYEVERADGQFAQRAALKLIVGVDDAAWSRFQSERQILAGLEHPGIARIIDGGLLASERPYMVMEYVDGEAIDRYCERRALTLREHVELIGQVGEALAYAHARLVVHSDLKPTNILVDGEGRARLIDFGIAHLADDRRGGTRQTLLSPDYAAPEQIGGGDVGTATDVYGLAAVLYRLVAGMPVRHTAGLPTVVAMMRVSHALPLPVSQAGGGDRWRSSSADRSLLGDLDAILARALAGDVTVRYPSMDAFRADLANALQRRPVHARRHERRYVLSRWLHRYRWPVLAVVAVVASLAAGLGVAVWQGREAARQRDEAVRDRARLEAIQQSVFHMFRSAGEVQGTDATASDVLDAAAQRIQDEFARDPAVGAPVLHTLGELYFLLNDYEAAVPLLRRLAGADDASVDPALIAAARFDLAQATHRQGDVDEARRLLEQAQDFWQADPERWQSRLLGSHLLEAQLLRDGGDPAAALALLRRSLAERIVLSGDSDRETGVVQNNLGVLLFGSGQFDDARASFEQAQRIWRAEGLEQSPDALNTLNNWGALEVAAGQLQAAEPLLREAVTLRRQNFGPSAATAALLNNYGKLLLQLDRPDDAIPALEEAVELGQRYAGSGSMLHVAALSGLAEAHLAEKRIGVAQVHAENALALARDRFGDDHLAITMTSLALAAVHGEQSNVDDARRLLADAERIASASGASGQRFLVRVAAIRQRYRLPED